MKMLKKIFTFVLLFSVTFSSIGINTYAKDTSALTEVEYVNVPSPTEDGKRTFTLKGSDLEEKDIKAKVVLKGSTERLTEVEKSLTFSEETKENSSKKVITLTFPKNEKESKTYEVSFSIKGSDESFVEEFKKTVKIRKSTSGGGGVVVPPVNPEQPKPVEENAILKATADNENLPKEGGEVNLIVFTKKINDKHISPENVKLQISLDGVVTELGKNAEVKGEKAKKTITLNFPKNNTSKEQVYTIKFNTKGSETDFQDEPIVTIKVAPSEQNNDENSIVRVTPESKDLSKEGGEVKLELITMKVNGNHISAKDVKIQVLLNNVPLKNKDLIKNTFQVMQDVNYQLFTNQVEKEIKLGSDNLSLFDEVVDRLNIRKFLDRHPNTLSGGEKQRVAIAGILSMKPEVIIFDESTAMLDPIGRKDIIDTILKLNKEENKTILYITHYMEEAVLADRVIVLNEGKIEFDDSPKKVFSNVETLRELGLSVPQVTELAYLLKNEGIEIPSDILTNDEMIKFLERKLK